MQKKNIWRGSQLTSIVTNEVLKLKELKRPIALQKH